MDIGPTGQRDLLRRNHRRRNAFYYRGGLHPDTVDWLARVAAVGGSVSGSTIAAADQFARSVEAGGFRTSIVRLNLFAGDNLTTALVPFYIGSARGVAIGTRATDLSTNFVSADYTETGASGGLVGNATNKRLQTGVTTNNLASTRALGVYQTTFVNNAFRGVLHSASAANTNQFGVYIRDNSLRHYNTATNAYVTSVTLAGAGFFFARSVGNDHTVYSNTTSGTGTTTAAAANAVELAVFCANENGSFVGFSACRLSGYIIGHAWTDASVAALRDAWRTFHLALGRP